MTQPLWTAKEAAAFLRIPKSTLYRYVALRVVPYRKLGKRFLFSADELAAWWSSLPGTSLAVDTILGTRAEPPSYQRRRTNENQNAAFASRLDEIVKGRA
jgi:excisionase family DNA binding protein